MHDLLLHISGALAVIAALIHGVIAETRIFPKLKIEPARLRTLLRLVWQTSTIAWIGGGLLLAAAPWMQSDAARHWIVATFAVVFALCAAGNAVATRGRHFGWMVLGAVVATAVAGY